MHYISTILFSLLSLLFLNQSENLRVAEKTGININSQDTATAFFKTHIELTDSLNARVSRFYFHRDNRYAWLENKSLNNNGKKLLAQLELSWKEGLPAELYNIHQIKIELIKLRSGENLSLTELHNLDILLTKAYINYASDLAYGRVDPQKLAVDWEAYPQKIRMEEYLEKALNNNKIEQSLHELLPKHEQYKLLKDAFLRLSETSKTSKWPLPGNLGVLKQNYSSPEVINLKKFLAATGDLYIDDSLYLNSTEFDNRLSHAVENFQKRHGLKADGIVGKNTLAEMNKPLSYRLNQIRLNMDRLRWMPQNMHNRDVIVNIPDFTLQYFENGRLSKKMNVVVGKIEKYTPALKDTMTYIVFNPTWNVPRSIATEEMLPKIKKDSTFLSRNNFMLLRGAYDSSDTVDQITVDWENITAENFPFSIVQKPGKYNSLGRIKFMLPNNYSIYLHDTPANYLFDKTQRDFSHGCIRLEKPVELAETILEGQMTPEEIRKTLAAKKTENVVLDHPVAVHVIYQTAWVDDSGNLQFRKDIYGFDEISLPYFSTSPGIRQIQAYTNNN